MGDKNKAQDGQCTVSPGGQDASSARLPVLYAPDSLLYDFNKMSQVTVVDTRRADEYAKLRVPGSLNIEAHSLPNKTFLRSQLSQLAGIS